MRFASILVAALALPSIAHAAMMEHYDLTSLALASDTIVRAERTGGTTDAPTYRVEAVLAGSGLAVGNTVTIGQSGYVTGGSWVQIPPLETTAILFLRRATDPPHAWFLVPSGLRVFADGHAYRFEQWSNPGPFVAVPQGRDPDDARGEETGMHLGLGELEQAIGAAVARADRVRAALALSGSARRAALLALMDPPRDTRLPDLGADRGMGFYEDLVATRAFDALIADHDFDGALDVYARMRGMRPWHVPDLGEDALVAIATASGQSVERRVAAIALVPTLIGDTAAARLVALAREDASATVRAAALDRLAGIAGVSSDAAWATRQRRIGADIHALLRERVAIETDARARIAIFACAERWEWTLPVRGDAAAAVIAIRDGTRVQWAAALAPGTGTISVDAMRMLRADGSDCGADPERTTTSGRQWAGETSIASCADAASFAITLRRGTHTTTATAPLTAP